MVLSCFIDSYFVRSIKEPKEIEYKTDKEQNFIEQMIIYESDEIKPITRITLSDITCTNEKYYLRGFFIIREDKGNSYIYPSFEKVFNSNTRMGILGEYESVAYFIEDTLKFETNFAGYKTIIGGNLDGRTLQDNIIDKTTEVINNYVERISGSLNEEFTYDKSSGIYLHSSPVLKGVEELIINENYKHIIKKHIESKQKGPTNRYSDVLNKRESLFKKINDVKTKNKYKSGVVKRKKAQTKSKRRR